MPAKDDLIHELHDENVKLRELLQEALGWMTEHEGEVPGCEQCDFVRRVNEIGVHLD